MSGWVKSTPLAYAPQVCNCCPPRPLVVPLRTDPHPGFGCVTLMRDGEYIESTYDPKRSWTFIHTYENVAAKDPNDWRVRVDGPMYGCVYQRHEEKTWVIVERLDGFA